MKLEDTIIEGDLGGAISLRLKSGTSINTFCASHIQNFDPDRLEVLAIRFYYGKEMTITLYAIDKDGQEGSNFSPDKIPVKKFKLDTQFAQNLLPFIQECNFTLTTGNFPLESMEVINK